MSVINQMLQDLNKRQQTHSLINIPKPSMPLRNRSFNDRKTGLVLVGAFLLLSGLSVYAWQQVSLSHWQNIIPHFALAAWLPRTMPEPVVAQMTKTAAPLIVHFDKIDSIIKGDFSVSPPNKEPVSTGADVQALPINVNTLVPSSHSPKSQATLAVDVKLNASVPKQDPMHENMQDDHKQVVEFNAMASAPRLVATDLQSFEQTITPLPLSANQETELLAGTMAVTEVKLTARQLAQKREVVAQQAEQQGRLDQAIDYYDQALGIDSSMHEVRKKLAALLYGQHQLAKAMSVLNEGLLLYPKQFEFALLLARVQQAAGQVTLALSSLALIPDTDLLARHKWVAQTTLAQTQGQFYVAEQAYRRLLHQEPQQGKWWMGLAYSLDSQKQFVQARQAYSTALHHSGLSAQATDYIEQRLTMLGEVSQ